MRTHIIPYSRLPVQSLMETGVSRDFQLAPPSRTHKTGETGMPAPGRSRFHGISTSLTLDFDRKLKLTDDFPSAGTPFSWARESRLFVVPFSRPKGRTERCCLPSLILSAAQNPLPLLLICFPYSLYIEQLPKAPRGSTAPLAEPLPPSPWTKGVDLREDGGSTFAKMGGRHPWTSGVALRGRRGGRSPRAGNGARQPHSFRIARPFQ